MAYGRRWKGGNDECCMNASTNPITPIDPWCARTVTFLSLSYSETLETRDISTYQPYAKVTIPDPIPARFGSRQPQAAPAGVRGIRPPPPGFARFPHIRAARQIPLHYEGGVGESYF